MVQYFQFLEKVQGQATKLVCGFKNLSYEECLASLKIPSMKNRVPTERQPDRNVEDSDWDIAVDHDLGPFMIGIEANISV